MPLEGMKNDPPATIWPSIAPKLRWGPVGMCGGFNFNLMGKHSHHGVKVWGTSYCEYLAAYKLGRQTHAPRRNEK